MSSKEERLIQCLKNAKNYPIQAEAAVVNAGVKECELPALLLGSQYLYFEGRIYNESGLDPEILRREQEEAACQWQASSFRSAFC